MGRSIETESRTGAERGQEGCMRCSCLVGTEVFWGMMEKFWNSGDGYVTLNVINATEFYISKTVEVAVVILYHNFLKQEKEIFILRE